MPLTPKHVGWLVEDRVATLTLNRPERKNPLTFESYAEMTDIFVALGEGEENDVRAVVITGAGGNFSSGGDVHEIIGQLVEMKERGDADGLHRFTTMTGDLVKRMRECPQPIVAAVDGVCAGAGAILAMASDLRVGTARSKVGFLFTRVGLSGADMGACAILPRIIGQGRASELLSTGRFMDGVEAERWGFFSRIAKDVHAEAQALASQLASGPVQAHFMTKRQLDEEWAVTIEQALDMEAEAQAHCMQTQDFHRAYEAFAAKRTPEFKGD